MIDRLIDAGITKFKFGIDKLSNKESKFNINKTEIDINYLLDLVVYTQKKLHTTQINIVVLKENLNEVPKFIDFAKQNKINCLNFIELINCGFRGQDFKIENSPTLNNILKMFDFKQIKIKQQNKNRTIFKYENILIKLSPDFCSNKLCRNTYSVLHENEIVLCHKNHINKNIDFNNISSKELKEIILGGYINNCKCCFK